MSKIQLKSSNLNPASLLRLTKVAYKSAQTVKEFESHLVMLPKNFEVLAKSTESEDTGAHNLRSVAYVNPETKEVVIAVAGTNPKSFSDLHDDIQLFAEKAPTKIEPMKAFIAEVMSQLGNASDYTFTVTGHSLGASVSQLTALHLIAEGQTVTNCITFDSPGVKKAFAYAVNNGQMQPVTDEQIAQTNFVSIQSRPNFVNTLAGNDGNLGSSYMIVLPKKEEMAEAEKANVTVENIGFMAYFQNLVSKVGKAAVQSFEDDSEYLARILADEDFRAQELEKIDNVCKAVKSELEDRHEQISEIYKDSQDLLNGCTKILSGVAAITKVAMLVSSIVSIPATAAGAAGSQLALASGKELVKTLVSNSIDGAFSMAKSALIGQVLQIATGSSEKGLTEEDLSEKDVVNGFTAKGVTGAFSTVGTKLLETATQTGKDFIDIPTNVVKGVSDIATGGSQAFTVGGKLFSELSKLFHEVKTNIELISVTKEHLLSAGWEEALEKDDIYEVADGYNHLDDSSVSLKVSAEKLNQIRDFVAKTKSEEQAKQSYFSKFISATMKLLGFTDNPEIVVKDANGNTVAFTVIDHLKDVLAGLQKAGSEVLEAAAVACDLQDDCSTISPTQETTCSVELLRELSGEFHHEDFAHNAAAAAA